MSKRSPYLQYCLDKEYDKLAIFSKYKSMTHFESINTNTITILQINMNDLKSTTSVLWCFVVDAGYIFIFVGSSQFSDPLCNLVCMTLLFIFTINTHT